MAKKHPKVFIRTHTGAWPSDKAERTNCEAVGDRR